MYNDTLDSAILSCISVCNISLIYVHFTLFSCIFLCYFFSLLTLIVVYFFFFFSSRRRHTRCSRDWSSDVCSSDLVELVNFCQRPGGETARVSYSPDDKAHVRKRIVRQDVLLIGRVNLDVRICIQCEVPHVSHNSHDCWPGRCCCRVCKCYVLTKRVFTWEKPSREALTNNDDGRR